MSGPYGTKSKINSPNPPQFLANFIFYAEFKPFFPRLSFVLWFSIYLI